MHRDIKPENMLICDICFGTEVKLADFGFTVDYKSSTPVSRLRTIEYMVLIPEVMECDANRRAELSAAGQPGYGPEVDCWAIGVLAYECLFNCVLFSLDDMQVAYNAIQDGCIGLQNRSITPEAKDFILSCLDLNPETQITEKDVLNHPWFSRK